MGGFDAELPIMEDADLCLRLHSGGVGGKFGITRLAQAESKMEEPSSRPLPSQPEVRFNGRGRIRMMLDQTAITSGRRLIEWGPLYGTYVHVSRRPLSAFSLPSCTYPPQALIGARWYFGASYQELHQLYRDLYTDRFR